MNALLSFSPSLFCLLFAVGMLAGFVDSMAGGGGLIALPFLLNIGLAPATALGTNRLQSAFGETSATVHFLRKKSLNLRLLLLGVVFSFLGAALGTVSVQFLHPNFLMKLLPFLLLLVLIYMLIKPSVHVSIPKMSQRMFFMTIGFALGFYNGFLGPGTGSFWMFALVYFLAFPLLQAACSARPLNLAGNIASTIFFALQSQVNYTVAITMGLGQLVGARLGAGLITSKGRYIVKPLFLIVVFIMTIRLFVKAYL